MDTSAIQRTGRSTFLEFICVRVAGNAAVPAAWDDRMNAQVCEGWQGCDSLRLQACTHFRTSGQPGVLTLLSEASAPRTLLLTGILRETGAARVTDVLSRPVRLGTDRGERSHAAHPIGKALHQPRENEETNWCARKSSPTCTARELAVSFAANDCTAEVPEVVDLIGASPSRMAGLLTSVCPCRASASDVARCRTQWTRPPVPLGPPCIWKRKLRAFRLHLSR